MTPDTPPLLPGWAEPVSCPTCREGYMRAIEGRYGRFFGCTRYPACRGRMNQRDMADHLDPPNDPGDWE